MQVRLEFTEAFSEPKLKRLAIWDDADSKSATADREVLEAFEADLNVAGHYFRWTAAVRAFCVLLLRACAAKSFSIGLEGGRGSAAQSLAGLVRECSEQGELNWIQHVFAPGLRKDPKGMRVSQTVFKCKINSKRPHFRVHFGPGWKDAKIIVAVDGRELRLPETDQLADALGKAFKQIEVTVTQRLAVGLELFAWNSQDRQLLPLEKCELPLSVQSGVSLSIRLSRPAFAYAVWITSSGVVQPLYPWLDLSWKQKHKPARCVADLQLPPSEETQNLGFYPIDSKPGVETAIVLAADKPFPASAEWLRAGLSKLVRQTYPAKLPDPQAIYRLIDPRAANPNLRVARLGKPRTEDHPMAFFFDRLLLAVGCVSPCVACVSFGTRG